MSDDLPYRPCVGVALVKHATDDVLHWPSQAQARRRASRRTILADAARGRRRGRVAAQCGQRELWEETNVGSIELIAELPDWQSYDLPKEALGRWAGRYRGQTQKWFLFRFLGPDSGIDVHHPGGGKPRRGVRRLALGDGSRGCPTWSSRSSARSTRRSWRRWRWPRGERGCWGERRAASSSRAENSPRITFLSPRDSPPC